MRRLARFIPPVAVCIGVTSAVLAGITRIDTNPSGSVVIGHHLEYTIIHTLEGFDWSGERRCLVGNPPGEWTPDPPDFQHSPSFIYETRRVGTRDFRGGVLEQTGGGDEQPPEFTWSYLTKQVTAIGPDRDTFTGPLNSYVEDFFIPKYAIDVSFPVFAGTIPIGPNFDGYPQERIRRPQLNQDSGWAGPSEAFYMDGSAIFDHKWRGGPNWDNIPVDTTFDDFYQQNRLVIYDCTGAEQIFTFAERHFQAVKTHEIAWKLVEVND
jgi:hypothetical protein